MNKLYLIQNIEEPKDKIQYIIEVLNLVWNNRSLFRENINFTEIFHRKLCKINIDILFLKSSIDLDILKDILKKV